MTYRSDTPTGSGHNGNLRSEDFKLVPKLCRLLFGRPFKYHARNVGRGNRTIPSGLGELEKE
jgi:hypothetical protein